MSVTANGDIGEAARAVAAAGLAELPVAGGSGPLAMRARITGSVNKPAIVADVNAGPGSVAIENLSSVTDLRLQAHLENDVVDLREAHAAYEGAVVNATGSIPLAVLSRAPASTGGTPASLHATIQGVTPAVLRGILDPITLEDLAGTVDIAVNVETPSADLLRATGDLTLTRLDLQVAGRERTDPHVGPLWRNHELAKAIQLCLVSNRRSVRTQIREAATAALPANAGHRISHIAESRHLRGFDVLVGADHEAC